MAEARFETYRQLGLRRRYRWRLRARNGEKVAQGTQSYRDRNDARRATRDAADAARVAAALDVLEL